MTGVELAAAVGIGQSDISRIENGKQQYQHTALVKLAGHFGLSVSELFERIEQSNLDEGPVMRGTVPLISWVQAGQWQEAIDNLSPGEGERIATTYKVKRHTYALRVRGDSMEPKFPDGCTIIVEPDENPQPGAYVIIRQNGDEATFKQLVQDGAKRYLKPLNPRYPIMELLPDAEFCGVVKKIEMDV